MKPVSNGLSMLNGFLAVFAGLLIFIVAVLGVLPWWWMPLAAMILIMGIIDILKVLGYSRKS